jgi:hypothetical protein
MRGEYSVAAVRRCNSARPRMVASQIISKITVDRACQIEYECFWTGSAHSSEFILDRYIRKSGVGGAFRYRKARAWTSIWRAIGLSMSSVAWMAGPGCPATRRGEDGGHPCRHNHISSGLRSVVFFLTAHCITSAGYPSVGKRSFAQQLIRLPRVRGQARPRM